MKLAFGYGHGQQTVQIPDKNVLEVLTANEMAHGRTGVEAVEHALDNPIGALPLGQLVKPGQKIAIIASDISRPVPSYQILPSIVERLLAAGCEKEDITVVFALGSHRKHTEAEMRHLAGDGIFDTVGCVDSDVNDCVHMGTTDAGTPVDITRLVAEADFRICTGNIEFHYFAGYSGGAKAIMPGVSTPAAIQANHSRMVDPAACAGAIEGNPIRQDIEEAAAICGVDFIVNVVLDAHKEIVRAVAGDVTAAHRVGCKFLDGMYRKEIPSRADIVIVSQGGAPKDLNLYQVQKALDNAKHAVRPGGVIVLVGSCAEGLGEHVFEEWMLWAQKPEDLIRRVREDFKLGGHKAAAIAMVLQDAEICLVSDLEPDFVRQIFLEPYPTAQAAVDHAFEKMGAAASVIVMPWGGSTLPHAEKD